jgi:hypothetical protein
MRNAVFAISLIGLSFISCLSPSERDQKEVKKICNRVADWQIANQPNVIHHDLDWTNGAWYKGLVEGLNLPTISNILIF